MASLSGGAICRGSCFPDGKVEGLMTGNLQLSGSPANNVMLRLLPVAVRPKALASDCHISQPMSDNSPQSKPP